MIEYQQANLIIKEQAQSFGREEVSLDDADGRVLSEDIYADRDYPPFNRSAMDGYALNINDWEKGLRKFWIRETIYAGQSYEKHLIEGACYKIMTGAAVPPSANVVIRKEDSLPHEKDVEFCAEAVKLFQNIAIKGEDANKKELIIPRFTLCNPSVISTLAAVGKHTVVVEKLPKVALFTTGDEIVPVDAAVSDIQIRNSNQHLLLGLLRKWKIKPVLHQHIVDDKKEITEVLKSALQYDIIIINGGVSAGDADYIPQTLKELGVVKLFHKVAIKPGKPVYFGQLPDKGVVFALPGNPFSSLVAFMLFVETYLYRSFGFENRSIFNLPLLQQRSKRHRLTEFFAVRLDPFLPGLIPLESNGSGDILAGLTAHGLAIHLPDMEILEVNALVPFIPYNNLFQ